MKVIPKKELIQLLEMLGHERISEDEIQGLFYEYGDDYYKDSGYSSSFELCKRNADRKALLKGRG